MDVEFGRAVCGDLDQAERREWLVTNGLGGFASGTIAGTLTRRYHGLLIAAFRPPVERTLLLTKIDETVGYRGASYAIASNRWSGAYISPRGFTMIERFYLDGTTPVWEFALADALLEKRIWMEPGANATYVRYRSLRGAGPLELSLRALVNYRDFHANTHAGNWHVGVTKSRSRTLRIDAIAGGRPFWLAADSGDVEVENVWYRDFVLAEETERGLDDRDDNLAAGVFTATLEIGDTITVVAADAELGEFWRGRMPPAAGAAMKRPCSMPIGAPDTPTNPVGCSTSSWRPTSSSSRVRSPPIPGRCRSSRAITGSPTGDATR